MTKHLYIHIPFCKNICSYCDFCRVKYDEKTVDKYLDLIENDLLTLYVNNKFETIYLGGGTPNCLNDKQLNRLLSMLESHLDINYEFTIECNPEFITKSQVNIFKDNKINRVSLGVQTFNEKILKQMNRQHINDDVINAIDYLKHVGIDNISCDLIYGFNDLVLNDIKNSIDKLIKLGVKHLSLYSLELKENSLITKNNYHLDDQLIETQLDFIITLLGQYDWNRYEVSNWTINDKYQSKHNKVYWLSNDWAAIGYGAYGLENRDYYDFKGSVLNWEVNDVLYVDKDYYQQILLMGLRLKEGLDLNIDKYKKAYEMFKKQIDESKLLKIKHNRLVCVNLNLLDEFLITII